MNQSIDLEAAKAAFFASGGQLIVLEGFTYRPLPQRKHPEPKPKRAKPGSSKSEHPQQSRAKARAAQIAELAKTMSCGEVAKLLGGDQERVVGRCGTGRFQVLQTATPSAAGERRRRPGSC
ncbi:hypothetical protein [Pseudomonas putida]|uniref:Uncharacterized protein n=1 Tax=Pseudomonas putida TaxID=303 RepID=A0A1B2F674_PSEPU|nr:hypothetical protein [Pseudomonas putida]ANY87700.1 hypothetical protein IEC33019_2144 [Pseudomonas putida]